ncbi:MAG: methionyl-tRNA formyltransferase [Pseudomonadota bacterium]
MGTSPFACPALISLLESKDTVVGFFTQPDRPQGRGRKVTVSPVKALALTHGRPLYQPESINNDSSIETLRKLSPDLIVVVAFGQILSQRILELPRWGSINVHASLLPHYRGAAPVNWVILRGEKTTGITTMLMDKGLDTGDILIQKKVDILPDENAGELFDRLAQLGAEALTETIEQWKKGELTPRKQDHTAATFAPPLKKENGLIDWKRPAETIGNHVRGMNPWPGAYTYLEGKQLKIFQTQAFREASDQAPGTVLKATDAGIRVSAGERSLLLTEVQLEGRKRLSAAQFLLGHPILPGIRLG